jgi:hypothetical protein
LLVPPSLVSILLLWHHCRTPLSTKQPTRPRADARARLHARERHRTRAHARGSGSTFTRHSLRLSVSRRNTGRSHRGSPDACVGLGPARSSVLDARARDFEPARAVRTPGGRPWIPGASDRRPIRRADPLRACAPHLSTRSTKHPQREFGATCETSVDFSLSAPHLSAGDRHHDNFRRQS